MSLEAEFKAGSLDRGRFRYFPVVPGRLEFSIELRRLLLAEKPQHIAVELPGFLAETYRRALLRLPEISVILYTSESDAESDGDRAVYVPVEPADPFTEALRTAEEIGAEVIFLEPDSTERPHLPDIYPDTYSVRRIGLDRYIEAYRVWPQTRTEEVAAHASAMAWKLQGADPSAKVLVVVSLNLARPSAGCDGGAAGGPVRGRKKFDVRLVESASGLPGRDHRRVSVFAGALRILPAGSERRGEPRPAASAVRFVAGSGRQIHRIDGRESWRTGSAG